MTVELDAKIFLSMGLCEFRSIRFIRRVFKSSRNNVFHPNQINICLTLLNNSVAQLKFGPTFKKF